MSKREKDCNSKEFQVKLNEDDIDPAVCVCLCVYVRGIVGKKRRKS